MTPIEQASAAIELLDPKELINYTEISKKFDVHRSTLSKRHRGKQCSREAQYENQRVLNDQQAKELVQYINRLSERGLQLSHEMLRNFAKEITGKKPGKNWPSRFIQRHLADLLSKYTTGFDAARKRADSAAKYALYLQCVERKLQDYKILPENIYNMDEKGFLIGILQKGKRIFSKRNYERDGLKQRLQSGSREWITCLACICADGTSLSPGLIYQAVSGKIQDTWLQDFNPADHSCFFASSVWLDKRYNRNFMAS